MFLAKIKNGSQPKIFGGKFSMFLGSKYFPKVLLLYTQASKIQRTKTEKNQKAGKSFMNSGRNSDRNSVFSWNSAHINCQFHNNGSICRVSEDSLQYSLDLKINYSRSILGDFQSFTKNRVK